MGAPRAALARAELGRALSSGVNDMLSLLCAKATTEKWPDLRVCMEISGQKCLVRPWTASRALCLCFVVGPHNDRRVGSMQIVQLEVHRKGKLSLVQADVEFQFDVWEYMALGARRKRGSGVTSGRILISLSFQPLFSL